MLQSVICLYAGSPGDAAREFPCLSFSNSGTIDNRAMQAEAKKKKKYATEISRLRLRNL